MEIKSIEKEPIRKYPKINQICKKQIQNSIPKVWTKIGISSLFFSLIIKYNIFSFAESTVSLSGDVSTTIPTNTLETSSNLAGDLVAPISTTETIKNFLENYTVPITIFQLLSVLLFIIASSALLITKFKNKNIKIKLSLKIIFIISVILFISSCILFFLRL